MFEEVHLVDVILCRLLVADELVPHLRAQLIPLAASHQVVRRVLHLHELTARQVTVRRRPVTQPTALTVATRTNPHLQDTLFADFLYTSNNMRESSLVNALTATCTVSCLPRRRGNMIGAKHGSEEREKSADTPPPVCLTSPHAFSNALESGSAYLLLLVVDLQFPVFTTSGNNEQRTKLMFPMIVQLFFVS